MVTRKSPEDKIIEILIKIRECNISALKRETGLSYYTLVKAINKLVSRNIVIEKRIGRLRVVKLVENP